MSIVIREDLLLIAIEEACSALIALNRTDLPVWRGKHVTIHTLAAEKTGMSEKLAVVELAIIRTRTILSSIGTQLDLPAELTNAQAVLHEIRDEVARPVELWISGKMLTNHILPQDPRVFHDDVRGPRVRVLDALSALDHFEQAYVLGDLLALEDLLTEKGETK